MKNIWNVLQRSIKDIIFAGMFSAVHFKLLQNDSNWITKAILCWVSYVIALIFKAIEVEKRKKSQYKSKIIDINNFKNKDKNVSLLDQFLNIIGALFTISIIYAFILGVILGLESWKELGWYMLLYFIASYILL